jgi:hypothetical protein
MLTLVRLSRRAKLSLVVIVLLAATTLITFRQLKFKADQESLLANLRGSGAIVETIDFDPSIYAWSESRDYDSALQRLAARLLGASAAPIRELHVSGKLSADEASLLSRIMDLSALLVAHAEVDSEFVNRLSHCHRLRELTLFDCRVDDEALSALSALNSLYRLNIWWQGSAGHPPALVLPRSLRELSIKGAFDSDYIFTFGGCQNLEKLDLAFTGLGDAEVNWIAKQCKEGKLPRLKELKLDHTAITDACADAILSVRSLRSLDPRSTLMSEEVADSLVQRIIARSKGE